MNELGSKTLKALEATTKEYTSLEQAYEHIEPLILGMFNAQRISIFQRRSHHRDLVARFKTGSETRELRVPVTTQSIAGYVAMAHQPLLINDVYDESLLKEIHFKLRFDKKYDRQGRFKTQSILCLPIMNEGVLLGVLEILNKGGDGFTNEDLTTGISVANILASAFKLQLGGTNRPFDYLVETGLVPASIFENILSNASIRQITQNLLSEQKVTERQIGEALAIHYQVPYIEFLPKQYHLTHKDVKLNISYLKRNFVAVLADEKEHLIVLMNEPNNASILMEIESALGTEDYQLAYSLPNQVLEYLGESSASDSSSDFDNILEEIHTTEGESSDTNESIAEDEPAIVRLVTSVLTEAKRVNASDIHIDPDIEGPTEVRMRVDGIMRDVNRIPSSHHNAVVARIKIMAGLNIAEKRLPQDGKLVFIALGQNVEARVATIPTVKGEGVTMRILAASNAMPLNKINMSSPNMARLKKMMNMPHGVFLVVGPTGSGKTTTLHAILGHLNTPEKKIWTAEDPVEITQYRLNQVQVNAKIGFNFANALRAFLRADPDIILIGEMRDKETAYAGIEASLTGHLVLSTLHTNSAPETITRLLDLGIDPVNFSDACIGILAQRLIRTLCNNCKTQVKASQTDIDFLKRQYGEEYFDELGLTDEVHVHQAKGCSECDETGYSGRTGVHELLTMTPQLRALIFKNASIPHMKSLAMKQGMRTLTQDAVLKVLAGDADIAQIQSISGAEAFDE